MMMIVYPFTPERPTRSLPTPGQHGHSPQRHTAAGTAAPTTADTGNTSCTGPSFTVTKLNGERGGRVYKSRCN